MTTSSGVVIFGGQSFVGWLQPMLEQAKSVSYLGSMDRVEEVQEKVAETKAWAVVVDLDAVGPSGIGMIGIAAQKGNAWTRIVVICPEATEELLPMVGAMRRRKWSVLGRPLVEVIGVERMLAGALTPTGLQDLAFSALEDEIRQREIEAKEAAEAAQNAEDEGEGEAA